MLNHRASSLSDFRLESAHRCSHARHHRRFGAVRLTGKFQTQTTCKTHTDKRLVTACLVSHSTHSIQQGGNPRSHFFDQIGGGLLKGVSITSMEQVYRKRLQLNPGAAALVAINTGGLDWLLDVLV